MLVALRPLTIDDSPYASIDPAGPKDTSRCSLMPARQIIQEYLLVMDKGNPLLERATMYCMTMLGVAAEAIKDVRGSRRHESGREITLVVRDPSTGTRVSTHILSRAGL